MANQPLNEQQLQALLRLKRHEQPPPGYFDDLLQAVQRRQREEMLRRPAWKLMAERVGTFFSSLRQDWAYAGSLAGVLLIGIGLIQIALPRKVVQVTSNQQAVAPQIAGPRNGDPANPNQRSISPGDGLADNGPAPGSSVPFEIAPNGSNAWNPNRREVKTLRVGPPRFIMDPMPASYEQTQIRF